LERSFIPRRRCLGVEGVLEIVSALLRDLLPVEEMKQAIREERFI
jgi:hypothetical protein